MPRKSSIEGGSTNKVEVLSEWRDLRNEASAQAKYEIKNIEGYELMANEQKFEALQSLLLTLKEDNDNRFLYKELALESEKIEAAMVYERRLEELGVAA